MAVVGVIKEICWTGTTQMQPYTNAAYKRYNVNIEDSSATWTLDSTTGLYYSVFTNTNMSASDNYVAGFAPTAYSSAGGGTAGAFDWDWASTIVRIEIGDGTLTVWRTSNSAYSGVIQGSDLVLFGGGSTKKLTDASTGNSYNMGFDSLTFTWPTNVTWTEVSTGYGYYYCDITRSLTGCSEIAKLGGSSSISTTSPGDIIIQPVYTSAANVAAIDEAWAPIDKAEVKTDSSSLRYLRFYSTSSDNSGLEGITVQAIGF